MTNHTQRVAEFCSGLDLADVPGDVVSRVQTALIDSVGCGIYGSTLPWSKTLLAGVQAFAGSGDAVVLGTGATLPPDTAALVNGAFIHSFEFDDLQRIRSSIRVRRWCRRCWRTWTTPTPRSAARTCWPRW